MKCLWIILLLAIPVSFYAQDDSGEDDFKPRRIPFTIGVDGGIAQITTPRAFKTNFNSVGDYTLSFDFGITPRFSASIHGRYGALQVRRQMVNKADSAIDDIRFETATTLNLISQGITLNYLNWVGKYTFMSYGLGYGNTFGRYTRFRRDFKGNPEDSRFTTRYIEPRIALTYFFEDHFAMNVRVSYSHVFGYFSPEKIGLSNGVISYSSNDLGAEIGYFTFAIGFTYSIKRVD